MIRFYLCVLLTFMNPSCAKGSTVSNVGKPIEVVSSIDLICEGNEVIVRISLKNKTDNDVILIKEHIGMGNKQHTPSFWLSHDSKFTSKIRYKKNIVDHTSKSSEDSFILFTPGDTLSFDYNIEKYYELEKGKGELVYIKYRGYGESLDGDYVSIYSAPTTFHINMCN